MEFSPTENVSKSSVFLTFSSDFRHIFDRRKIQIDRDFRCEKWQFSLAKIPDFRPGKWRKNWNLKKRKFQIFAKKFKENLTFSKVNYQQIWYFQWWSRNKTSNFDATLTLKYGLEIRLFADKNVKKTYNSKDYKDVITTSTNIWD